VPKNKNIRLFLINILIFLIGMFIPLYVNAEFRSNISISAGYDDNPFLYQDSVPSASFGLGLESVYYPDNSLLGISYGLSATGFSEYSDRAFLNHNLNFTYDFYFNETGSLYFSPIISVLNRIDSKSYEYYDYLNINSGLLFGYENSFSDIQFTYTPEYMNFYNNNEISYSGQKLQLSFYKGLPTKTSINLAIFTGFKIYPNIDEIYTYDDVQSPNGGNKGKKKSEQVKSGWSKIQENTISPGYISTDNNSSIAGVSLNIGQSVFSKTGVNAFLNYHKILNKNGTFVIPGTQDLYAEEQIYNDSYSYNNTSAGVSLNQILPLGIRASIGFSYSNRDFMYKVSDIYQSEIDEDRKDEMKSIRMTLSKNLLFDEIIFNNLSISLNYAYTENQSNADLFRYRNNYINISFSTLF
jgi:hypothetical protein